MHWSATEQCPIRYWGFVRHLWTTAKTVNWARYAKCLELGTSAHRNFLTYITTIVEVKVSKTGGSEVAKLCVILK